jgi:cell division protein ZapA (FtsZ GTPase activity inhibitor)
LATESVAIRIRGQEYRVRNDGDADQLLRIANYLNETMARVEARTGTIDSLGVATLTALNLARELVELREGRGVPANVGRLQDLIELAETALEGAAPAA